MLSYQKYDKIRSIMPLGEENIPITQVSAEEIKDSRGNPTLKIKITAGEAEGEFSVPSGASTGAREAHELRDPDGKGVKVAIDKVSTSIAPVLIGKNVLDQEGIDNALRILDGTEDKSNLGGNAMIGVSIAAAVAAAKARGQEVFEYLGNYLGASPHRPRLYMNLVNGGRHAAGGAAFQEYILVPNTEDAKEAVALGMRVQTTLKEIISQRYGADSLAYGDEGGFAVKTSDVKEPLRMLRDAVKQNGLENEVRLALDVAANSFYTDGAYLIAGEKISKEALLQIYKELVDEFNLLSIEDPFQEEDFESFAELRRVCPEIWVVGDDLTVTSVARLAQAVEKKSINAMIIKPNQIGTLTETIDTIKKARASGIEIIVSHRSGETQDAFIADLAVAAGAFGLKAGAPSRPERLRKYDRLINIFHY